MFHRRSLQPSRRAVLHVQAPGDPPVPPDLAAWYNERAFHFYVTGIRLPRQVPVGARPRARYLVPAFADLDIAEADLHESEGMASVIVTAQGRGAIAAALWHDGREPAAGDALILQEPALPPGVSLSLDVACPVLVLTQPDRPGRPGKPGQPGQPGQPGPADRGLMARLLRPTAVADQGGLQLGRHVTWLRLPGAGSHPGDPGRPEYFDELGRWLGAYMYGQVRDQLL
jgi:hypothetical protein